MGFVKGYYQANSSQHQPSQSRQDPHSYPYDARDGYRQDLQQQQQQQQHHQQPVCFDIIHIAAVSTVLV